MHARNRHPSDISSERCCCLLCFFLFLGSAVAAAAILLILFVLKPKKPIFHLHAVQLGPLDLDAASSREANGSSPMASLTFVTQNPNKLGIRYSSSILGILYGSNPIGTIELPTFYQPPRSVNLTIVMHASFEQLNLTTFLSGLSMNGSSDGWHIDFRLVGGVQAQAHVFNFSFPKIKVSLDCRINMNYGVVALSKGVSLLQTHKAILLSNFQHISQKCSFALCI